MPEIPKWPDAETDETDPKTEKEGVEMKEVDFNALEKGDKLVVEILPGETDVSRYEIVVDGKTKHALRVSAKSESKDETKEFAARMLGGLTREKGTTPGLIKISGKEEDNCLYFENLKDVKTKERICRARRTAPIGKIWLIKKGK
jgi:hypothetical protein